MSMRKPNVKALWSRWFSEFQDTIGYAEQVKDEIQQLQERIAETLASTECVAEMQTDVTPRATEVLDPFWRSTSQ